MTNPHPRARLTGSLRSALTGAAVLGAALSTPACLNRTLSEQTPATTNVVVATVDQEGVTKIDLLFMIDNSVSMADKQQFLRSAVPQLVRRLVEPICLVDPQDPTLGTQPRDPTGNCPDGTEQEFTPINDIHIGVLSSSMGSHGGDLCQTVATDPADRNRDNDRGWLVPSLPGVKNPLPPGDGEATPVAYDRAYDYLSWAGKAGTADAPNGVFNDVDALNNEFALQISAVGENGCGFEASLEAWYRFLIDPVPPPYIEVPAGSSVSRPAADAAGLPIADAEILAQRAAFLRPDSLFALIMLSDENDCSIVDYDFGWLIARGSRMFKGTNECANEPNSPCCRSCATPQGDTASGQCAPFDAATMGCTPNRYETDVDDPLNLRCYNHKRRFGIDLLFPISRYVQGLTSPTVSYRDPLGVVTEQANPLFSASSVYPGAPRTEKLVFVAGIVGVPWQDIATADTRGTDVASLTLKTADDLAEVVPQAELAAGVTGQPTGWDIILGDPLAVPAPIEPLDPLMRETRARRDPAVLTSHPLLGTAAAPVLPEAVDGGAPLNPINGHEWDGSDDLQYACIFPLPTDLQRVCEFGQSACDCAPAVAGSTDAQTNSPLCRNAAGDYTTTQLYAKAYPGIRFLQLLKGIGPNAIVASVCPKEVTDTAAASYGYNPAVAAIIDRLKQAFTGKCLPRQLATIEDTAETFEGGGCFDTTVDGVAVTDCGTASPVVPRCRLVEVVRPDIPGIPAAVTGCDPESGRNALTAEDAEIAEGIRESLAEDGRCDAAGTPACADMLLCGLQPLVGEERVLCQNSAEDTVATGYCYIEAARGIGNPAQLETCPSTEKQKLRFVSRPGTLSSGEPIPPLPYSSSTLYIACLGDEIGGATVEEAATEE